MVLGAWVAADLICLSIGVHAYVAPARRGGMGGRFVLVRGGDAVRNRKKEKLMLLKR